MIESGTIFIPKKYNLNNYPIDKYYALFNLIRDKLGWQIVDNEESVNLREIDTEYLLILKPCQKNDGESNLDWVYQKTDTKIIGYFSDLHPDYSLPLNHTNNLRFKNNIKIVLSRCDKILVSYKSYFEDNYPEYKYNWLPQYFGPMARFSNNRKYDLKEKDYTRIPEYIKVGKHLRIFDKCLLTGAIDLPYYPLRQKLAELLFIQTVPHPGYGVLNATVNSLQYEDKSNIELNNNYYIGGRYTDLLKNYYCAVTTSSIFKYTVSKYFEIPAAGTLLIADRCNDLDDLGFVPWEHYVPINSNNYQNIIIRVLNAFYSQNNEMTYFKKILNKGMKMVHDNHSVLNRYVQFRNLIKSMEQKDSLNAKEYKKITGNNT